MKRTVYLSAVIIILIFAACKKETTVTYTANAQVTGYWIGKYGTTIASSSWSGLLRADGTCRFYDGGDSAAATKAEGIYNINDGKLVVWYKYINSGTEFSLGATLSNTTLNGTWGSGQLTSGSGIFYLNKQ
jgi:hypothetical protein